MNRESGFLIIFLSMILSGCLGALQAMNTATGLYQNARAGYTAYNAAAMAKDLKDTQPLFAEAEIIKIRADLSPRMRDREEAIKAAFTAELVRETKEVLGAIGRSETVVCTEACPAEGRMTILHFREKERPGMITKVLAGDRLTGTASVINASDGAVLRDEQVDGQDYAVIAAMINLSVMKKLLKEKEDDPKLKAYLDKVNEIPLLSEEGEKILTGSK
ncbi:MAG: hypothetical protein LLH30_18680 [Candidatus Manganitrophus sp. SA1]|nr:hypothetical protein [Candidatus Manganitrophus morganii]